MQSQFIRFWIGGARKSKADALRKAGYSNAVIRQPDKVLKSPAVIQELERLGHGSQGIHNGLEPKAVVLPSKPTAILELSEENLEQLKELLINTPGRNPISTIQSEHKDTSSVVANKPNCNMFGEELYAMPQKAESMSSFSSI